MSAQQRKRSELPPTAGLPVQWTDLWRTPPESFAAGLQRWLHLPHRPLVTCSATAAVMVALRTFHRRNPDRNAVILPAYTCPLVLRAVLKAGLQPRLCDTEPGGINLDPAALTALCDDSVLAVVPTHLGGRVADLDPVLACAAAHQIAVLEDAAQAMGATDHRQSVGLRGDAGVFSLAVGKGLTTYEGGVLFSRDPDLQAALQVQADTDLPFSPYYTLRRIAELCGCAWFYRPDRLWSVYGRPLHEALDRDDPVTAVGDMGEAGDLPLHRMDRVRLRMAANALPRLLPHLEQGREMAARRLNDLRALGVTVVDDTAGRVGVWPFFMVLLPTEAQRDQVLQKLWRTGVGVTRLFIHALPDYPRLHPFLKEAASCPNARDLAARMLTVSNTPWLNEATWQSILAVLRRCL